MCIIELGVGYSLVAGCKSVNMSNSTVPLSVKIWGVVSSVIGSTTTAVLCLQLAFFFLPKLRVEQKSFSLLNYFAN